jgi:prophage antirepressor-like protein
MESNNLNMSMSFEDKKIRIVGSLESPLFIAKDLCEIFDYIDVSTGLKNIPQKYKMIHQIVTDSGNQNMITVTQHGLHLFISRSKKLISEKFYEWILDDVLPLINTNKEYQLVEYKKKLEEKDSELHNLKIVLKRQTRKKFSIGHKVYIASNPDILDMFKIGETGDLNIRLDHYAQGAPKPYKIEHHRNVFRQSNRKSIEDLILTILSPYRVESDIKHTRQREWVGHIDLESIINEMDSLLEYVHERILLYDPEFKIPGVEYENMKEKNEEKDEIPTPTKLCFKCNIEKNIDAFYTRLDNTDGKEGRCKICYNVWKKELKDKKAVPVPENITSKTCKKCKEIFDLEFFSLHNTSRDGHSFICFNCKNVPQPTDKTEKNCSSCKELKPMDEYTNSKSSSDGKSNYCKICSRIRSAQYKANRVKNGPSVVLTSKICSFCKIDKPIDEFWNSPSSKCGKTSQCKICCSETRKDAL